MEAHTDTTSGDQTTVRTWQIPAAGGFLLHEDTGELAKYLEPGKEVATFRDTADLCKQVVHYLRTPEERAMMSAAGHERCVNGDYTYAAAAKEICSYHESRASQAARQ
jgi:spore maturation protein CgeB